MTRKLAIVFVSAVMLLSLTACSQSTARNYAAVLAANTGRLNDEFEQLTKSRQQIYASQDRLNNLLELSTLRTDSYNQRRLAEWMALKNDTAFKERYELFILVRSHTDAAASREVAIESLASKVVEARLQAKGKRSEQLAETAKHLAALSKEPTLEDQAKFLADYAKNVQESVKKAKEDAQNAVKAAKNKVDTVASDSALLK